MDFEKLVAIHLRKGNGGGDPRDGLCLMEMVSYFDGADCVTDHPECACPMLTNIGITLNDCAPSQQLRDTLKPLLPLFVGSRDESARRARALFIMRECAVRILAVRLDRIADKIPAHLAADIRGAGSPEKLRMAVQKSSMWLRANADAKAKAKADAYANANAYAYAYADAYANANAYADADAYADAYANAYAYAYAYADADANAYADAYADAYANAYAYAYAYAYANANAYANAYANANANANAKKDRAWAFEVTREILTEAIKLGAHGGLDLAAPTTGARAEQLLELVR